MAVQYPQGAIIFWVALLVKISSSYRDRGYPLRWPKRIRWKLAAQHIPVPRTCSRQTFCDQVPVSAPRWPPSRLQRHYPPWSSNHGHSTPLRASPMFISKLEYPGSDIKTWRDGSLPSCSPLTPPSASPLPPVMKFYQSPGHPG